MLRLSVWLTRHCPRALVALLVRVIVGYFYLTSPQQRQHVAQYQARLRRCCPEVSLPARNPVWQQFLAFGQAIVDRFAVWQGRLSYRDLAVDDPDGLYEDIQCSARDRAPGQLLVCSHLGNVEICRALVSHNQGFVLNVLVHSRHAEKFNQALRQAGADDIRLIQVVDLDLPLMMALRERIATGEWLAIAADRTPVRGGKTVGVSFLGERAYLPQGPWLLAGLLGVPVNLVFCGRERGHYRLRLERFSPAPQWSRRERAVGVQALAQRFAVRLGQECVRMPLQWFNFYDFWASAEDVARDTEDMA